MVEAERGSSKGVFQDSSPERIDSVTSEKNDERKPFSLENTVEVGRVRVANTTFTDMTKVGRKVEILEAK